MSRVAGILLLPFVLGACGAILGLGDAPIASTDAGDSDAPDATGDQGSERTPPTTDAADSGSNDGTPAGEASAPYPADRIGNIPGLALWFRADKGVTQVGDLVVAWTDQTANGNNAQGVVDGTNDYRPTVIDGANGLPAIHFGSDLTDAGQRIRVSYLLVADSPSLQFHTGDFLIELVARPRNTQGGLLCSKELPLAPYQGIGMFVNHDPGVNGMPTWQVATDENDVVPGPSTNDIGRWRVFGVQRAGSVLSLRLDGPADASAEAFGQSVNSRMLPPNLDVSAPGTELTLGAQHHPGYPVNLPALADIAEVVAIEGPVATKDLNGLEGYLTTKYAIH
jgi:hypothetical protein